MATFVEAGETGILIDPGATLSPSRFNLPPSEEEWEELRRANDRISAYAARASLVFVSHYHEDHFRSDPATYAGRTVLVKDPKRMVAGRQAKRGEELWRALGPVARVVSATGCRVIMDHHALRDTRFTERFRRVWETGAVVTAAGYLGRAEAPLESRRPHAWAAARKAPAKVGERRAIMTPATRRIAKGGHER